MDVRPAGNDGPFSHEHRDIRIRGIGLNGLPAREVFAAPEIVPPFSREIDGPASYFVFGDRINEQGGTKHELIADAKHILVAAEIHDQGAHERVIILRHHSGKGIHIRHQPISLPVIPEHRLVGGMRLGSDIEHLAVGELSVHAKERAERSELKPSRIQFTPLVEVGFGRMFVPWFHRETADVHRPIGNAGEREVHPPGDLRLHVIPPGSEVAAPCGGCIALGSGEGRSCQNEHALIRTLFPLAFKHGTRLHERE